ncbi:MAG: hypothetical protein HGGPFJEG_00729 [Ignavibacteria bacterium]|nr:hypothetical protein [Ignavibacteria bacterium]
MARLIIILLIIIIILSILRSIVMKFLPDRSLKNFNVRGRKSKSGYKGADKDNIIDAKYEEIK